MRVAVVVAAMFFCAPVFAQGGKLKSVTNSIGMELIEIPAGKFTMGSPVGEQARFDDEAQVSVTLTKPFGLGKTEVTQGQWKKVMGTEPWGGEVDRRILEKISRSGEASLTDKERETLLAQAVVKIDQDCPATFFSWEDATEFCKKLTEIERKAGKLKADEEYRLPTEAEWEYACRAGTTTAFSFGNDESKLGEYAWFDDNTGSEKYAHKVGMKKPNPWGLHDMHGNVSEWCSDWYDDPLTGGVDPVGPEEGSGRVFRGGSWGDDPGGCRSASRHGFVPSFRFNYLGFRVARSQSAQ